MWDYSVSSAVLPIAGPKLCWHLEVRYEGDATSHNNNHNINNNNNNNKFSFREFSAHSPLHQGRRAAKITSSSGFHAKYRNECA